MHLTVIGSGNKAGIPVSGCLCRLCRQARAINHLRRHPPTLLIRSQGESLLLDAGSTRIDKRMQQDRLDHVLLSAWLPSHWHGLLPIHMGTANAVPVLGPAQPHDDLTLAAEGGQLQLQPILQPGQETLAGRFRILPFALNPDQPGTLSYGLRAGEHRLVHIPVLSDHAPGVLDAVKSWQPELVILGCPRGGPPEQRIARIGRLFDHLGQPNMLITGLDHHLDRWLTGQDGLLPPAVRIASDGMRLDVSYVTEYRRLESAPF